MLECTCIPCVQEAVASRFLQLFHIPGNETLVDLLTKFLSYQKAIRYLCPLLFWHADMSDIPMKKSDN